MLDTELNSFLAAGSAILLQSKAFDPKVFLSTVHPNATFNDLSVGTVWFEQLFSCARLIFNFLVPRTRKIEGISGATLRGSSVARSGGLG